MAPRKSHPKGIDPAYPQKNFVKAYFENRGDAEGFTEYMYGDMSIYGEGTPKKKSSHFGHSVDKRVGYLRMSGAKGAHRIGARKK